MRFFEMYYLFGMKILKNKKVYLKQHKTNLIITIFKLIKEFKLKLNY